MKSLIEKNHRADMEDTPLLLLPSDIEFFFLFEKPWGLVSREEIFTADGPKILESGEIPPPRLFISRGKRVFDYHTVRQDEFLKNRVPAEYYLEPR